MGMSQNDISAHSMACDRTWKDLKGFTRTASGYVPAIAGATPTVLSILGFSGYMPRLFMVSSYGRWEFLLCSIALASGGIFYVMSNLFHECANSPKHLRLIKFGWWSFWAAIAVIVLYPFAVMLLEYVSPADFFYRASLLLLAFMLSLGVGALTSAIAVKFMHAFILAVRGR